MSYIVGTSLSKEKLLVMALSSILGLGFYQTTKICRRAGFSPDCRVKDLTSYQWSVLEELVESLNTPVGPDLRRLHRDKIKRLCLILSYRGSRHRRGLPVRGQRTHTNAKRRVLVI